MISHPKRTIAAEAGEAAEAVGSEETPELDRARAEGVPALEQPRKPFAIRYEPRSISALEQGLDRVHRLVERGMALVGLIVFSPVIAITALIIRLDSPGPLIFVQRRAARSKLVRGRDLAAENVRPPAAGVDPDALYWVPTTFRFVKFRTMWVDAAERFPEYYWWNYDLDPEKAQAMYYKLLDDPRLTRVGRWLRRTSLDELPNLWNVLRGEIRLIGPRPENPGIQAFYSEEQMEKFTVEPGLSGPAEVYGRSELSVGERVEWDLDYARNRSVMVDLKVFFQTIWVVLTGRGAR